MPFPDDVYECLLRFLSCIKSKDYERSKQRKWKTDFSKLCTNRPIQVEGAFGVLKQDFQFGGLLHRGHDHVRKILYLLTMGFNISKLHHRIQDNRIHTSLLCQKEIA